jgi:hypothetical protein
MKEIKCMVYTVIFYDFQDIDMSFDTEEEYISRAEFVSDFIISTSNFIPEMFSVEIAAGQWYYEDAFHGDESSKYILKIAIFD